MRTQIGTIFVASLAGFVGGLAANQLLTDTRVLAQADVPSKLLRVQRLELVDRSGLVRGVLDATDNQLPRLEFMDHFEGKKRSLLLNPSMIQMKIGEQSAIISTAGASFFAGKNRALLDLGTGFGSHPQLIISSPSGAGRVSSLPLTSRTVMEK